MLLSLYIMGFEAEVTQELGGKKQAPFLPFLQWVSNGSKPAVSSSLRCQSQQPAAAKTDSQQQASNHQPPSSQQPPATSTHQPPAASNLEPAANGSQAATSQKQPANSSHQPATTSQKQPPGTRERESDRVREKGQRERAQAVCHGNRKSDPD